jgi:hypothetical protein
MICPSCNNGVLLPTLLKPSVLNYRGFSKQVGVLVFHECSNCLYEGTEALKTTFDVDAELGKAIEAMENK